MNNEDEADQNVDGDKEMPSKENREASTEIEENAYEKCKLHPDLSSETIGNQISGNICEKKNLSVLEPDHPLLEKYQQALKEHLLLQIDHLKDEIFEFETGTKKNNAEREELGVQNYELQQNVCKQQRDLEILTDQLTTVTGARAQCEAEVEELRQKAKSAREQLIEEERQNTELKNEINSINLLTKQISEWEEKMESEIMVNKTISEKTRKINLQLIEEKRNQDIIIYKLNQEIWRLMGEVETTDMQINVKERECEELSEIAALGNTNIEAVQAEYRCLMHSWNSVLVAIGNRDKVMDCLQMEDNKLQEKLKNIFAEIQQIKKLIHKELKQNENFSMLKGRVEMDIKACRTQLDENQKKCEQIEKELNDYQRNLLQLNNDIEIEHNECQNAKMIVDRLLKLLERENNEKTNFENQLLKVLENQLTNDKVALNLHKLLSNSKKKNSELEILVSEAENKYQLRLYEIDNLQREKKQDEITVLEMESHFKELERKMQQLTKEIHSQELEVRKKERENELLSLRYEKTTADHTITANPQEIKTMRLEKCIEEVQEEIKSLQSYWLREQQNLLQCSKERQEQIQKSNILKKQLTIVQQKILRARNEVEDQNKDLLKIERNINQFLNKSVILSDILFKKRGTKSNLEEKNIVMQISTENSLKNSELECLKLEADIAEIEEAKVNIAKELIEFNREALEWEKKIMLATETKNTIKSEQSTEGEVFSMRQEIHRMEIRFSQLRKAQDKLIADLQHSVSRRDAIYYEAEARAKRVKGGEEKIRTNYTRKMDNLRNQIKQFDNQIQEIEKKIKVLDDEREELQKEIEKLLQDTQYQSKRCQKIVESIELAKTARQYKFEVLVLNQRKLNIYSALAKDRTPYMTYRNEAQMTEEFKKNWMLHEKLQKICQDLISDFPQYKHELERVINTLKINSLKNYYDDSH